MSGRHRSGVVRGFTHVTSADGVTDTHKTGTLDETDPHVVRLVFEIPRLPKSKGTVRWRTVLLVSWVPHRRGLTLLNSSCGLGLSSDFCLTQLGTIRRWWVFG